MVHSRWQFNDTYITKHLGTNTFKSLYNIKQGGFAFKQSLHKDDFLGILLDMDYSPTVKMLYFFLNGRDYYPVQINVLDLQSTPENFVLYPAISAWYDGNRVSAEFNIKNIPNFVKIDKKV